MHDFDPIRSRACSGHGNRWLDADAQHERRLVRIRMLIMQCRSASSVAVISKTVTVRWGCRESSIEDAEWQSTQVRDPQRIASTWHCTHSPHDTTTHADEGPDVWIQMKRMQGVEMQGSAGGWTTRSQTRSSSRALENVIRMQCMRMDHRTFVIHVRMRSSPIAQRRGSFSDAR
jgi:hypothetical protein